MSPIDELVSKYLDGTLDPDEANRLNLLLKNNPEHLRQFTQTVMFEQDIRQSVIASANQYAGNLFIHDNAQDGIESRNYSNMWRKIRPLGIAASIGLIIGLFSTSATSAFISERKIWGEGFEGLATRAFPGIPTRPGVWSGDDVSIVSSEHNIAPKEGQHMLRFERATYNGENSLKSSWGDVYRLVDIRELGGPLTEKSTLRLSANFAAAPTPKNQEYACSIGLFALAIDLNDTGNPPTLPWIKENSVSTGSRLVPLNHSGKWQELTQELIVPSETRYVLIHLAMVQKLPLQTEGAATFPAHYLDDIRLDVVQKHSR